MLTHFLRCLTGAAILFLLTACQIMSDDTSTGEQTSTKPQETESYFWPWEGPDYKAETKEMRRKHKVLVLLERGDLAFTKDRLNAPQHDNALLYYYTALKVDPNNKKAFRGLSKVADRFRSLARTAHDNGNGKQTRYYLQQAEIVSGASDPSNIKLRKELNSTPAGRNSRELDKALKAKIKARKAELKNNPLLQDPDLLKEQLELEKESADE